MKLKLTVTKVSEKTKNGNFIVSAMTEGVEYELFGVKAKRGGQLYLFAMKTEKAPKIGAVQTIELDDFTETVRDAELVDQTSGEMRKTTFKWLAPKPKA